MANILTSYINNLFADNNFNKDINEKLIILLQILQCFYLKN